MITALTRVLATSSDSRRPPYGPEPTVRRDGLRRVMLPVAIALSLLASAANTCAEGVDQKPEAFINEVFAGKPPAPGVLWITRALRGPITKILGHPPDALRVRYWGAGHRTAWILEEIGKERPITVGLVVNNGHLETVKVLAFRESRGWEVRYPFFTDQFKDAGLTGENELDRSIDGISGATLSVRALKKLARLALFLHNQTPMANDAP
jgi:FMN-binding domain